ncbi:MAG: tRNA (N(6)-L-threonylcarbamoyladenosine(37)-C(2))-methylthiotransferase MtaB [bacterium]|nr:tRNA (N(6)-L-threonylcarbamoyladenosine(37)-C(2))-methylthiotransferase MtaB [bacterium]
MADGFHSVTFGCKLNQFDSAAIEGELVRRGYARRDAPERAALVIVNTCTVTHRADADARKAIRALRRSNPDCTLLVTGCYAELDPETLREQDGVDRVFGNRDKPRLAEILDELGFTTASPAAAVAPRGDRGCDGTLGLPDAVSYGERSRAFLKVQEGCRLACSYCIIPTVRGPSRSVAPGDLLRAARRLFESGYHEVVLTGVNTGDYGRDLAPRTDLRALLDELLKVCGPRHRIRLNSLEPLTVSDEIVALMARERRIAPHLQVPLQSGSDPVLQAMRRNYRTGDYLERLETLSEAVPGIGLGADVIVGFPGETEEDFERTVALVRRSPLSYLHVFSWSARPGTPASELPGRVDEAEIRRRSARLRSVAAEKSLAFRRSFEGRSMDAVLLGPRRDGRGTRALTGNFIEVAVAKGAAERRGMVRVRIDHASERETLAVLQEDADAAGRPPSGGRPSAVRI